jgi:hypothetical protein
MNTLRGVTITEGKIGNNVSGESREFGLIGGGVAVVGTGKATLATAYKLLRPSDAVALGIDAAYDTANDVRVYRHIAEFYRMAGEGKALHLMLVDKADTPLEMIENAKALVLESGAISDIAFMFNPEAAYVETLVDGLNADVKLSIPALQTFADWCDTHDMPLHTILEGRGIGDTLSALADLRDLTVGEAALSAHKVTLVCGQDWTYADGITSALGKKFADVGTFLGCIAAQAWNRNPGEVATQNLTNSTLSSWLVGGLSNHKKYTEVYESLETMNEKGYVFPIKYTGLSGYWWNDGHVCAPIIIDNAGNMNQHTIYYSHTIDMAKRVLRIAFLPEVKKVKELEKGKLPSDLVADYNKTGNNAFDYLAGKGLISDGATNTSKDSDLLIAKQLDVEFGVAPTGCVNIIKGTLNLKSS